MNVQLPKEYKVRKRDIVIYTICIIICVVALTVAVTVQVLGENVTNKVFHANKLQIASEEEQVKLRTDFENMFTNEFTGQIENAEKKDESKNFVYTTYENQDTVQGNYTLDVHIPNFNIKDETLEQINNKITTEYKQKVNQILNNNGSQIIYSVEYNSYVENDILFLIIRSNLKEGVSAQRIIIQTYNYDLRNNKEINLEEVLKIKNIDKSELQGKITDSIKTEQKKVEDLEKLGYNVYSRDVSNDMYKIENSKEFYLTNDTLYIIYAYGNDNFTSEIDLIVI